MSSTGLLMALAAAAMSVPDAKPDEIDVAVNAVPKSFADCASLYAKKLEADAPVEGRFSCGQRHFEHHPGFDGSTYEMATALVHAAGVANLYIDSVLVPALEERLRRDNAKETSHALVLREFVRSQRAAGENECKLYSDWFRGGTIRSIMSSSCGVGNADELVEALLRFNAVTAAR
ncbi:MAG TPA: hypothetical protein VE053_11380 [Allosphingosinicella sp.]|nr:hypothetical protein [Allosphingosinicella sp.]